MRRLSGDRRRLDEDRIAAVLWALKTQALAMLEEGRRLTGHPGLPPEPTPNLAAEWSTVAVRPLVRVQREAGDRLMF